MPTKYLSLSDVANRIGVSPNTMSRYKLPEPDVTIGGETSREVRGWLPETIEEWNKNRPGKGNWRKTK